MNKYRIDYNGMTREHVGKTLGQMRELGYYITDTKYRRGYVSRKICTESATVYYAPRRKQYAVLLPCWESTRYCYVAYLSKDE